MKNIHLIPTDKPSKLVLNNENELWFNPVFSCKSGLAHPQNIYITSDEEIKEGDWFHLDMSDNDRPDEIHQMGTNKRSKTGGINFSEPNSWTKSCKKITLTTDQELNGVQAIDDKFLEWFVKNPSCESVNVEKLLLCTYCGQEHCDNLRCRGYKDSPYYKIIIPQEEPKQEDEIIDISDHDGIGNAVDNLNNEEPEKETIEIKDGNQLTHQFEEWNTLFELQSQCKNLGFSELQIHSVLSNKFQLKSRDKVEQETLEEAAKKLYPITGEYFDKEFYMVKRLAFIEGAKYQSERMYSEEEMRTAISIAYSKGLAKPNSGRLSDIPNIQNDIFQQFKKK
jgi:hypothetical protein